MFLGQIFLKRFIDIFIYMIYNNFIIFFALLCIIISIFVGMGWNDPCKP